MQVKTVLPQVSLQKSLDSQEKFIRSEENSLHLKHVHRNSVLSEMI